MPHTRRTDGLFASPNAVYKVLHMIVGDIKPYGVGWQGVGEQFGVAGLDAAARYKHRAVFALKSHPIFALVRGVKNGAIGIGRVDIELGEGIVAVYSNDRPSAKALYLDGAGMVGAKPPLSDVVVVGTPVGHHATGVVQPPAEVAIDPLGKIVGQQVRLSDGTAPEVEDDVVRHISPQNGWVGGGWAKPEIEIEIVGHRLWLEGATGRPGGQMSCDCFDLADQSVSRDLTGKAKTRVGTLLASYLKHAAGFLGYPHQLFAFINGKGKWFFTVDILTCP